MNLMNAIETYIGWRRSLGAKFNSAAALLRRFSRQVGGDTDCDDVSPAQVLSFLTGDGRLNSDRANKYSDLAGFYRYAISRNYATRSPLPRRESEPRQPAAAPPWVFSRTELQCLFNAIETSQRRALKLNATILRMVLLLLYGAGLRISEALGLTLEDVDLNNGILTIRDAKFNKTRLVPVGTQLADALRSYAKRRMKQPLPKGMNSTFLAYRDGQPLAISTVKSTFRSVLKVAGIQRDPSDSRRSPCLHSLRHTAAVHRVESWYRQGADVSRLLLILSTWLGHRDLNGTQVYLTMTPQLLHEASLRFERHVAGGAHE